MACSATAPPPLPPPAPADLGAARARRVRRRAQRPRVAAGLARHGHLPGLRCHMVTGEGLPTVPISWRARLRSVDRARSAPGSRRPSMLPAGLLRRRRSASHAPPADGDQQPGRGGARRPAVASIGMGLWTSRSPRAGSSRSQRGDYECQHCYFEYKKYSLY